MSVFPEVLHADQVIFGLIALASLVSALAVVSRRNPVAAVAWLVVHFVATACAYILLSSQFIAAVQVLVYAGAIMVLFLFVIMLLAVDKQPEAGSASGIGRKALVGCLALVLITVFGRVLGASGQLGVAGPEGSAPPAVAAEDTVAWLADALFSRHVVAFEASSMILIAAMAGVLVFTTRRTVGAADAARAVRTAGALGPDATGARRCCPLRPPCPPPGRSCWPSPCSSSGRPACSCGATPSSSSPASR